MELKDLLLKKEELPILYGSCFQIPLHPKLLNPNIYIETGVAENCFNELLKDWKKDNELINYYKSKNLHLNIEKNPGWHCLTREEENGLITYFSISRDFGGGIHFNEEDSNCETSFSPYIKFSKEKEIEFKKDRKFLVYVQDNVDFFPGALFLRNWGIKYMNEVFKELF
jgi:hypothetical protein